MFFLLQDLANEVSPEGQEGVVETTDSFFDFLVQGGWPMIILALLLIFAIFVAIERWLTIRKANADSAEFMDQVRGLVKQGNIEGAKGLCQSRNDPFARMIHKGLSRLGVSNLKDIEASIGNVGNVEILRLERRLSGLATVAGAAPMIGFLGTVIGMIEAFNQIVATGGNANATQLAGGIGQAMITTAAGLVVGILAFLAYNSLTTMVNKVMFKLELTSNDFIDLLQEPAN